jgi:hypothetical protein
MSVAIILHIVMITPILPSDSILSLLSLLSLLSPSLPFLSFLSTYLLLPRRIPSRGDKYLIPRHRSLLEIEGNDKFVLLSV